MSKLDELIAEYCPNGVKYLLVGEVCDIITDYTAAGSFADIAKNVQYINNGKGYAQLIRTTDLKSKFENPDRFVYVDEHAFQYLWRVNLNTEALIMPNVGNCGEVYYITPDIFPEKNNVLGPNAILVKSSTVNNRFLYHLFLAKEFQTKLAKIISPTGQTKFNKTNFKQITIPVPPLPVQEEIVQILDSFTQLTAELTAELQARKKQYEYYKHHLLSDGDNIVELSTVAFYVKARMSASEVDENTYVGVDNLLQNCEGKVPSTHVPTEGNLIAYKPNDVMIGNIRPYLKKIWFADNSGGTNADVLTIRIKNTDNIMPRYLYYVLSSEDFFQYDTNNSKGAKMPRGDKEAIMKYQFSVPTVEKQHAIIGILDRFDTLCNDLTSGLPAEIEARQKQYEYYRDKLLTFQELA